MAHPLHIYLGLPGDVLSFVGGVILALDALNKEREFNKIKKITRVITSPKFQTLTVEVEGEVVKDGQDVDLTFLRRSVRLARIGFSLVAVGFLFLMASRVVEIFG
jgi:hypothetical protein